MSKAQKAFTFFIAVTGDLIYNDKQRYKNEPREAREVICRSGIKVSVENLFPETAALIKPHMKGRKSQ